MNTIHHRHAWGIALASAGLALTTACGADVPTAPASVDDGADLEQSSPAPGNGGSARPGRLPDAWDN